MSHSMMSQKGADLLDQNGSSRRNVMDVFMHDLCVWGTAKYRSGFQ